MMILPFSQKSSSNKRQLRSIMKQAPYSFLVLTDHRVHKPGNPIYSLLPALHEHPDCSRVHVASRGNPANDPFFQEEQGSDLEVLEIRKDFGFDPTGKQFLDGQKSTSLEDHDCILMRLPRPVPSSFMEFLVEKVPQAVFINHPTGIEKTSNKQFLLQFPDLCPPMKLCHSVGEVLDFAAQFPIVLKPLKEYGGKGIVKIKGEWAYEGKIKHRTIDFLHKQESFLQKEGYLAMQFLKNVHQGDKRILVAGGQILGASLRLPPEGSWICNVAQGGNSVLAQIEAEEQHIVQQLTPRLLEEGILIFGLDTLVGDDGKRILSEINTLSVGGFHNIQQLTGKPIVQQTIQSIINYVSLSDSHRKASKSN